MGGTYGKERKEVRIEDAMAEKEALDKKAQEILEEGRGFASARLQGAAREGNHRPSLCLDRIPALLHDDRCHQCSESSRDPHDFPARLYIPSLPDVQVGDEKRKIPPIWDIAFILARSVPSVT